MSCPASANAITSILLKMVPLLRMAAQEMSSGPEGSFLAEAIGITLDLRIVLSDGSHEPDLC